MSWRVAVAAAAVGREYSRSMSRRVAVGAARRMDHSRGRPRDAEIATSRWNWVNRRSTERNYDAAQPEDV